jgi:hypothetical protein
MSSSGIIRIIKSYVSVYIIIIYGEAGIPTEDPASLVIIRSAVIGNNIIGNGRRRIPAEDSSATIRSRGRILGYSVVSNVWRALFAGDTATIKASGIPGYDIVDDGRRCIVRIYIVAGNPAAP